MNSATAESGISGFAARLEKGEFKFSDKPTRDTEAAQTISAKDLEGLAAGPDRVVRVPVQISNAIIDGPLNLQHVSFEYELSITNTTFKDVAKFSFAVFNHTANFQESTFEKPADFRAARCKGDFDIRSANFVYGTKPAANGDAQPPKDDTPVEKATTFKDLHVEEALEAADARFGKVNFQRIDVGKDISFRRAVFGGEARFNGAQIHSDAYFDLSEFNSTVYFDGIRVGGSISFRSYESGDDDRSIAKRPTEGNKTVKPVRFGVAARPDPDAHEARFLAAHIEGDADFDISEFNATAYFDGIRVGGKVVFRNGWARLDKEPPDKQKMHVTFARSASFPVAVFESAAQFDGAEFKERANFDNSQFQGSATFDSAKFATNLVVAKLVDAKLVDAKPVVAKPGDCKTSFIAARFERGASFKSAEFNGEADFTAAHIERDAEFLGATFSAPLIFQDAHFQVVRLQEPEQEPALQWRLQQVVRRLLNKVAAQPKQPTMFGGTVDLCGFTYDRIYVNINDLFSKIKTDDRQPYVQLEQSLRKVGDDTRAGRIYLERHRVERGWMFSERRFIRWFGSWLYKGLANYGIHNFFHLTSWSLVLLIIGTVLFSYPWALRLKNEEKTRTPGETVSNVTSSAEAREKDFIANGSDGRLKRFTRALGVSVHQFLPADVPVGSDWVPAPDWPSFYGTVLRLMGTLLVATGVASASGLLRRLSP